MKRLATCVLPLAFALSLRAESIGAVSDAYLDRYFRTFPTRATSAGRHDLDRELERLDAADRASWLAFNRRMQKTVAALHPRTVDEEIDRTLLRREIDREIYHLTVLRIPERNPLYWTGIIGNSVVFLLVRDHDPAAASARATRIPRLAANAKAALEKTPSADLAPELFAIAISQARASATFFRNGFATVDGVDPATARAAADAVDRLADFLQSKQATGTPRLGRQHFAENFRLVTGVTDVEATLAQAVSDLAAKRKEAADYSRTVWSEVMTGAPPSDDIELLRALFDRLARDHARSNDEWVTYATNLVDEAEAFSRAHDIVTLPEPRTLVSGRSPAYFVGQSVGGVYPAGPYSPESPTLYFLPMPSDDATPQQAEAFYRDFNDHFQRMITPHEILPGHYVQLKSAARNPHKIRAVFPDDVYVEGWGTFCERLMLDQGWGGPLDRLAHLKKQMENIARTIVDIRVHTRDLSREELYDLVTGQALQGEQLARNMWVRSITTSPQLTFYYLGYRDVRALYDDARAARGSHFQLKSFMDELLAIGPAPLRDVRRIMNVPTANRQPSATVHRNNRSR
jgi:uncharacterized protein (DUF885 family)